MCARAVCFNQSLGVGCFREHEQKMDVSVKCGMREIVLLTSPSLVSRKDGRWTLSNGSLSVKDLNCIKNVSH